MLRHLVHPRGPFVRLAPRRGGREVHVRRSVAPALERVARMVLAPLAAIAAGVGGIVFLLLLPICGIASIAEAVAKTCWTFVRDAVAGVRRPAGRRS